MNSTADKRASFRALHADGFFVLPNAWDAGSAMRMQNAGFKAVASTSSGAAWAAGKSDGELSLDQVLSHLELLVNATDLPVNADFENGFADEPGEVATNVTRALQTGIAALSIEDWSGTRIYEKAHAIERIAAAREAIDRVDPNIVLVGRNENFRVPDMPTSESVARAVAYANAGADCLFVPMLLDHGAIAELVSAVAPKALNVLVHDYEPHITQMASLGVRRCSTGGSIARRVWTAFDSVVSDVRRFEVAATNQQDHPATRHQ